MDNIVNIVNKSKKISNDPRYNNKKCASSISTSYNSTIQHQLFDNNILINDKLTENNLLLFKNTLLLSKYINKDNANDKNDKANANNINDNNDEIVSSIENNTDIIEFNTIIYNNINGIQTDFFEEKSWIENDIIHKSNNNDLSNNNDTNNNDNNTNQSINTNQSSNSNTNRNEYIVLRNKSANCYNNDKSPINTINEELINNVNLLLNDNNILNNFIKIKAKNNKIYGIILYKHIINFILYINKIEKYNIRDIINDSYTKIQVNDNMNELINCDKICINKLKNTYERIMLLNDLYSMNIDLYSIQYKLLIYRVYIDRKILYILYNIFVNDNIYYTNQLSKSLRLKDEMQTTNVSKYKTFFNNFTNIIKTKINFIDYINKNNNYNINKLIIYIIKKYDITSFEPNNDDIILDENNNEKNNETKNIIFSTYIENLITCKMNNIIKKIYSHNILKIIKLNKIYEKILIIK
jgi:hypothetical protein